MASSAISTLDQPRYTPVEHRPQTPPNYAFAGLKPFVETFNGFWDFFNCGNLDPDGNLVQKDEFIRRLLCTTFSSSKISVALKNRKFMLNKDEYNYLDNVLNVDCLDECFSIFLTNYFLTLNEILTQLNEKEKILQFYEDTLMNFLFGSFKVETMARKVSRPYEKSSCRSKNETPEKVLLALTKWKEFFFNENPGSNYVPSHVKNILAHKTLNNDTSKFYPEMDSPSTSRNQDPIQDPENLKRRFSCSYTEEMKKRCGSKKERNSLVLYSELMRNPRKYDADSTNIPKLFSSPDLLKYCSYSIKKTTSTDSPYTVQGLDQLPSTSVATPHEIPPLRDEPDILERNDGDEPNDHLIFMLLQDPNVAPGNPPRLRIRLGSYVTPNDAPIDAIIQNIQDDNDLCP
uniref:Uncharacterized protein n=1 Tax=Acrobeloides nanus TaxID=290746 RepID=A0A914CTP0_9BILA